MHWQPRLRRRRTADAALQRRLDLAVVVRLDMVGPGAAPRNSSLSRCVRFQTGRQAVRRGAEV